MSSYSPALEYFCQRMEGLSVGMFRLEAQNQTSNIQPQSIVRFTLPSNALVDLHSFAFHFNAQTSAGAGTSGTVAVRLPNKIESMLNRVEVSIGGVAVSSGANFYGTLCHAKEVLDRTRDDAGMNHPELITNQVNNNYVPITAAGAALTVNEQPPSAAGQAQFTIDEWQGFISECEPRVLDTSLMGDVVISLYLEQPNLCITNSDHSNTAVNFISAAAVGGQTVGYTVNNVYATVRCYSLASGVYDNMVAEQMSKDKALEIGFKQYFSFRDHNTGSSRWTVATQSLDRVIVCHHADVAPTGATDAPVLVAGYNAIGETDSARLLGLGKAMYIHPYSNFRAPVPSAGALTLFEWQLNGAKYPQWRASVEDVYNLLRLASKDDYRNRDEGLRQYSQNRFVTAIKLTLDAPNARFIQGLDTRSVSLNGYYYIYNAAAASDITLFAEVTSSLLVSPGRQIELVQ